MHPAPRAHPVSMTIIDRETGQTLATYRKDGRIHVAGRPTSRYAIQLVNHTGGRVLVVLSVDGVNVVSGETAAVNQSGYVLDPWQSYDIAGWRKSDTAIAAFVFASLGDSYAARTGRPGNVGVIGMAAFLEKTEPRAPLPRHDPPTTADRSSGASEAESRAEAAKSDSGSGNAAPRERLGTGHGAREWSVSRRTSFERLSSVPQDVVEIAYDSYANLVLAGVIPAPAAHARAFPSDDPRGFVPDPPGR